jgi:S-adenosylmethionine:tRNA ribosyltransferase-isomerase
MQTEMHSELFDYDLPQELIAQTPVEPRDSSRLLVVKRSDGTLEHRQFRDLGQYLDAGDLLVANESRVMPARLAGRKIPSGGRVEVLLLRPAPQPSDKGEESLHWEALVSPGRRVREGAVLGFGDPAAGPYMQAEVVARAALGARVLRFDVPPARLIAELGQVPLPPYIREELKDPERYQTVYARAEGSAAAPTAGLHFTSEMIDALRARGIGFATVVLHVGLDTFRPVHEANVLDHKMHREWYQMSPETSEAIGRARSRGGRIVGVGTTTVRVLETATHAGQGLEAAEGWTDLFITPGHQFGLVDAMITNFHLPRTTLLMLVSAFAGAELMKRAYEEAIRHEYRFYSFGDAMLIL